ncbi:MAG TPA: FadR/GntR family transcriptional regulator [Nocardioides sp.]|jgi:DNA-binding FadR family transcriptional regulator
MAVTDDAIEAIKGMITSGELKPGDRLPREADLADRLGLSRSSLREAVKALTLIRVLTVRRGDGTYVTSLDPGMLMDAMGFVVEFHHDDTVLQFLQVRRFLEPPATAIAAISMPDADIAELGALLDSLPANPEIEVLVANDMEFHGRIAAATGNPLLCSLLETVSGRTQRARTWRGLAQENAVQRTVDEHHAIHRAIRARDPEAARAWSTAHIAGVEEWLRQVLATGSNSDS